MRGWVFSVSLLTRVELSSLLVSGDDLNGSEHRACGPAGRRASGVQPQPPRTCSLTFAAPGAAPASGLLCDSLRGRSAKLRGACSTRVSSTIPLLLTRASGGPTRSSFTAYSSALPCLPPAQSRLDQWTAAAGAGAGGAARALFWLARLLTTELRRLLRWLQLAAVALALQPAVQQQQLALAGAAGGAPGSDAGASAAMQPPAQVTAATQAALQEQLPAAGAAGSQVIDFISAATTGAVEQLRHTLMDASQGIESKMSALERTASNVQGTLFQAARAHSEAVRSNPQGEHCCEGGRPGTCHRCPIWRQLGAPVRLAASELLRRWFRSRMHLSVSSVHSPVLAAHLPVL